MRVAEEHEDGDRRASRRAMTGRPSGPVSSSRRRRRDDRLEERGEVHRSRRASRPAPDAAGWPRLRHPARRPRHVSAACRARWHQPEARTTISTTRTTAEDDHEPERPIEDGWSARPPGSGVAWRSAMSAGLDLGLDDDVAGLLERQGDLDGLADGRHVGDVHQHEVVATRFQLHRGARGRHRSRSTGCIPIIPLSSAMVSWTSTDVGDRAGGADQRVRGAACVGDRQVAGRRPIGAHRRPDPGAETIGVATVARWTPRWTRSCRRRRTAGGGRQHERATGSGRSHSDPPGSGKRHQIAGPDGRPKGPCGPCPESARPSPRSSQVAPRRRRSRCRKAEAGSRRSRPRCCPGEGVRRNGRFCHASRASITSAAPTTLTLPTHDLVAGAALAEQQPISYLVRGRFPRVLTRLRGVNSLTFGGVVDRHRRHRDRVVRAGRLPSRGAPTIGPRRPCPWSPGRTACSSSAACRSGPGGR